MPSPLPPKTALPIWSLDLAGAGTRAGPILSAPTARHQERALQELTATPSHLGPPLARSLRHPSPPAASQPPPSLPPVSLTARWLRQLSEEKRKSIKKDFQQCLKLNTDTLSTDPAKADLVHCILAACDIHGHQGDRPPHGPLHRSLFPTLPLHPSLSSTASSAAPTCTTCEPPLCQHHRPPTVQHTSAPP